MNPSTPASLAVGIDVGATSCRMAGLDSAGRSAMLRNRQGDLSTPCAVLFDDDEIVVGRDALKALVSDPDRAADEPKRDLGQARYWRLVRGRELPPEVVLACILGNLRDGLAATTYGDYFQTVLSVPASFGEPGRKAICDAGYLAGLNVLDIINEPLAAAIALGEQLGYLDAYQCASPPINLLVVDLGSSAFDVAIIQLAAGSIRVLAVDGDAGLGGRDWSHRLRDHVADEFIGRYKSDPRRDLTALASLNRAVEETKHTLSTRHAGTVHVECGGQALDVTVSRDLFEELTADLVERAAYCLRQVIVAAQLSWRDVHEVLLVGGAARMPMIPRMLRKLSSLEPRTAVNPDEAVARGAALYAGSLLAERDPTIGRPRFFVHELASRSLGLEITDATLGRKQQRTLIPRNSPLPTFVSETFSTAVVNERSIAVRILEGEHPDAEHCSLAARAVITGLPQRLPRGAPIEVTYERLANGRLMVSAALRPRGERLRVILENDAGLTEARLELWREALATPSGFGPIGRLAAEFSQSASITSRPLAGRPASLGAGGRSSVSQPAAANGGAATSGGATGRLKPSTSERVIKPRPATGQGDEIGIAPQTDPYRAVPASDDPFKSLPPPPDGLDSDSAGYQLADHDPLSPEAMYAPDPDAGSAQAASWDPHASASEEGTLVYTHAPRNNSRRRQPSATGVVMNLVGHLTASILGLGLGYYVLCKISPESNFLHLSLPGVEDVKPPEAQQPVEHPKPAEAPQPRKPTKSPAAR
jgi:molecular chaperone DnaK